GRAGKKLKTDCQGSRAFYPRCCQRKTAVRNYKHPARPELFKGFATRRREVTTMEECNWRKGVDPSRLRAPGKQNQSHEELMQIRDRVDELDQRLSQLIAERLQLARRLAPLKEELGLPVQDRLREAQILERIAAASSDNELAGSMRAIYESI